MYRKAYEELASTLPPGTTLRVQKELLDGSAFEPKVARFEVVHHGEEGEQQGSTPMWLYCRNDKLKYVPHFPSWWTRFWLWATGWKLIQSWRQTSS